MFYALRIALGMASLWAVAFACATGAFAAGAGAEGADAAAPEGCASSAYQPIVLDRRIFIDEVRVELQDGSPAGGRSAVTVYTGERHHTLETGVAAPRALAFAPDLRGSAFAVDIHPVLDADLPACVAAVTMWHGGEPVLTFRP
jgi:hypothetical protein